MGGLAVDIGIGLPRFTPNEGGSDLYRLFANGEDGFLFGNFGDLTRLFTGFDGQANVANDADPVGLALDDSKWARRTFSEQLAVQSELIVNGDFASGTLSGWSFAAGTDVVPSYSGGRMSMARGAGAIGGHPYQSFSTVVGRTYRVTADIFVNTTNVRIGTSIGASDVSGSLNFPVGSRAFTFVAATTTTYLSAFPTNTNQTSEIDNVSVRLVTGNHALQSTTARRPFWRANSGKPYLNCDGSDDGLISSLLPRGALTLASSFRAASNGAVQAMLGGGNGASNQRVSICLDIAGRASFTWGADLSTAHPQGSDITGADHVLLLTGDAVSVDLWLDGALLYSGAPNGSPNGGGFGIALGGRNNSSGLVDQLNGRLYAALALNRRVTPAEIALITSKFRSAYQ